MDRAPARRRRRGPASPRAGPRPRCRRPRRWGRQARRSRPRRRGRAPRRRRRPATRRPAARSAATVAADGSSPVTTGRWNSEPAEARTHLRVVGVDRCLASSTTPSAPAASAARRTVPALPGSRTWASTATRRGRAGRATLRQSDVERSRRPPRPPAVSPSRRARRARSSPTCIDLEAGGLRGRDQSACRSACLAGDEQLVDDPAGAAAGASASRTACGPSARNGRALRPARLACSSDGPPSPAGCAGTAARRPCLGELRIERQAAGALTSAGRAALATSTRAAKAGGSLTASSASILRSTSTPAALRPWMNRL